jgi:hypothetical protein
MQCVKLDGNQHGYSGQQQRRNGNPKRTNESRRAQPQRHHTVERHPENSHDGRGGDPPQHLLPGTRSPDDKQDEPIGNGELKEDAAPASRRGNILFAECG